MGRRWRPLFATPGEAVTAVVAFVYGAVLPHLVSGVLLTLALLLAGAVVLVAVRVALEERRRG